MRAINLSTSRVVAIGLAAQYAQEKTDILEQRLQYEFQATRQEIERRVSDPYLVMLRKKTGLPSTLSASEVFALQRAQVDLTEEDPTRLLQLAALSYLEADGHAARIYLHKVAENTTLTQLQRQFVQQSLPRLEHPEAYRDSLGIWVAGVIPDGNFDQSGIQIGDVIIAINSEPVHEPLDIASALPKQSNDLFCLPLCEISRILSSRSRLANRPARGLHN